MTKRDLRKVYMVKLKTKYLEIYFKRNGHDSSFKCYVNTVCRKACRNFLSDNLVRLEVAYSPTRVKRGTESRPRL